MSLKKVFAIRWTEHERGWGSKGDGYTIFSTDADRKIVTDKFWADRKAEYKPNYVPDYYISIEDVDGYVVDSEIKIPKAGLFVEEDKVGGILFKRV